MQFPESKIAKEFLDTLHNPRIVGIGQSAHNPIINGVFDNVDRRDNKKEQSTYYNEQIKLCNECYPVNIIGFAEKIPVDDRSYDFAICSHVLEHTWKPDKALEEILRILKPEGYACIIVPDREIIKECKKPETTLDEILGRMRMAEYVETHHNSWSILGFSKFIDYYKNMYNYSVYYFGMDDTVQNGIMTILKREDINRKCNKIEAKRKVNAIAKAKAINKGGLHIRLKRLEELEKLGALSQDDAMLTRMLRRFEKEAAGSNSISDYDIYRIASICKKIRLNASASRLFTVVIESASRDDLLGGALFHLGEVELTSGREKKAEKMFLKTLKYIPEHVIAKHYLENLAVKNS